MDLTKIAARIGLRRSRTISPLYPYVIHCHDSAHSGTALRASLVSLDRTLYELGKVSKFEVMVENTGSVPIRIPSSPHLTDFKAKDPAQKFSYLTLQINLWIAAGEHWRANTGGSAVLYGGDDYPGTMLSLQPGQWVRIIGEDKFDVSDALIDLTLDLRPPVDRVYAEASVYREEILITPTQRATVERQICISHTPGQSVPIQLTIPVY